MSEQSKIINSFVSGAKYYMVKYDVVEEDVFGKILTSSELTSVDLTTNEIYRSVEYKNDDNLFVYSLKPLTVEPTVNNPLGLLIRNLKEARIIERVYPGIFRWVFDGVFIKAYAIVPSGDTKVNSTISRYGGTELFIKILRQHLDNIGKMHKGLTPDYNFLKECYDLGQEELSIGSINKFNNNYVIGIELDESFVDVLVASKDNRQVWKQLNVLDMKYWGREINPDFIVEAKHIKLSDTIDIDEGIQLYPPCVKMLMGFKNKGNYNRFLLSKFLLSAHSAKDAKFKFDSVLTPKEREHIKTGNCSLQWNYILNNIKRYSCPACNQLKSVCDHRCRLRHPLEKIQKHIEKRDGEDDM